VTLISGEIGDPASTTDDLVGVVTAAGVNYWMASLSAEAGAVSCAAPVRSSCTMSESLVAKLQAS
jgi:hypothetical protein